MVACSRAVWGKCLLVLTGEGRDRHNGHLYSSGANKGKFLQRRREDTRSLTLSLPLSLFLSLSLSLSTSLSPHHCQRGAPNPARSPLRLATLRPPPRSDWSSASLLAV